MEMETSETTKNSCAMLHPRLLPLVNQCLHSDSINTQGNIIEIKWPKSSSMDPGDTSCCDRFTMDIPYCGTQIPWEVIFDRNHLDEPPDFIFSTQDDLTDFNPSIEKLTSLLEWDATNESCLCSLLEELLSEYRCHHRNKLEQYDRMAFEMEMLREDGNYSSVDVLCNFNSQSSLPVVRFFVPLSLDSLVVPAYLTKDNPGPDKAALLIQFSSPKSTKPIPSLHISPRIERMLGDTGEIKLPHWGGENTSMVDYIPQVHRHLRERMEAISLSYVRRKEYIASCLSFMGTAVLEYDTEQFKTVAFLFETQGFSFIARLTLSDSFPSEQPTLVLQSVYHRLRRLPCLSYINDYPYSPRWSADEMAAHIRSYVLTVASQFREISQEKGECLG